jgi:uncharacterized cysteine cluster protein YcgN (CxxCxxCC family)
MTTFNEPDTDSEAEPPFWRRKTLDEMSREEWESLCDGCGKCCLNKIEWVDTGEVEYTDVACQLLDLETCRCQNYDERTTHVPDCLVLSPNAVGSLSWLPSTCAYRLIAEGRDLQWWHPLVSGDPQTVHLAGVSVRNKAISENMPHDLDDRIVTWPE